MLLLLTKHKSEPPPSEMRPSLPLTSCGCGHPYSDGVFVPGQTVSVHHPAPGCTGMCTLFELHCHHRNDSCRIVIDAHEAKQHGYFLQPGHLISLEFMYKLADDYAATGQPMQSFVHEVNRDYARCSPPPALPFAPLNAFRAAFTSFVACIEMDFTFQCPECGTHPDILIADGTSCTFKRTFYHGTPITDPCVGDPLARHPDNTGPHRAAVADTDVRRALTGYAAVIRRGEWEPDAAAEAHGIVQPPWLPGIVAAVDSTMSYVYAAAAAGAPGAAERVPIARDWMARFVGVLGSDSPVAAYLPPATAVRLGELITRIEQGDCAAALAAVSGTAPIFYHFLHHVSLAAPTSYPTHPMPAPLPSHFVSIRSALEALIPKSADLLQRGNAGAPRDTPVPATSIDPRECARTGICCGLPKVRDRYPMQADGRDSSSGDCRHAFVKPGGRTGGIFTWYCKHGICYCFHVIPKAEGRNEPYSFLVSHFEHAPRAVVYDFSCQLHSYCLNRAPAFFAGTTFAIDRFHQVNHKSCADAYRMDNDPVLFSGVNSQHAEQGNSSLADVKGAILSARQSTCMLLLRFFLASRNAAKRAQLLVLAQHRNTQVR